MTVWREEGSRGLAHVAMKDFPTAADAFFEIVDNPMDYRRGRALEIDLTIDKDRDTVIAEDRGGEGMDDEGVADWLKWGSGHRHEEGDIGRFHKGGKSACGYLADGITILTRRAGHDEVWRFEDRSWNTHTEWTDYGEAKPYTGEVPAHLSALPREVGFTRIELTRLVPTRRYNLERLRLMLGNTYRRLIADRSVTIRLNGEVIEPLHLPLSTAFEQRRFDIKLPSGGYVRGWVGRLDRDAVRNPLYRIPGGMRLLYQRRLVAEGEYFGHRAEGKGLLASLIGEVEVNNLEPLSNKTGFQLGTAEWEETEQALHEWLAPIIAIFRRAAEEQPITREERKRANTVRRQLQDALRYLSTSGRAPDQGAENAPGHGRRSPAVREDLGSDDARGDAAATRRQAEPRTPPPDDAVGTLRRLRRRLGTQQEVPPIVLVNADPSVRSDAERGPMSRVLKVTINKDYALYQDLQGNEAYLAETALLELLQPDENETMHPKDYIAQLNQCLVLWHKVAASAASAEAA